MKQLIMETLAKMQKYFGKKLDTDTYQIYIEQLSDFTEQEFKTASVKIMRNFEPTSTKPFPLVKDFLYYIGKDDKSVAVNIVTDLRRSMEQLGQYASFDLGDPSLAATIRRYGGWEEMVLNNTDEWWSLHERNFITAYESARRSGMTAETRIIGQFERDNRAKGYTPEKLLEMKINPISCGYSEEETRIAIENRKLLAGTPQADRQKGGVVNADINS